MLTGMYIPQWNQAIGPAIVQVVLIGVLWFAMFSYARPRYGARRSAIVLALGIAIPVAFVLGLRIMRGLGEYGDECRRALEVDYSDAFLAVVEFFELYTFAVVSFVGLTVFLGGLVAFGHSSRSTKETANNA